MPAAIWPRSGDRETYDALRSTIPGARAYFFETGTTTPLTVYQDDDLTIAHEHPVVADAYGKWPAVFIPAGSYRVRILDDEGVQISDFDGVVSPGVPGDSDLDVSAFSATLLDDADAATWLNTLGFNAYFATLVTIASAAAFRAAIDVQQNGISTVTEKTDSYTLALVDVGTTIHMNKATANDLIIPPNASVAWPVGGWVNIVQIGVGVTTIDADTGVTLNGISAGEGAIAAQWGGVTIQKKATNTWVMVGLHAAVA